MTLSTICILTETYYPVVGGGETQARLLAQGLIANGYSAMLVTRRSAPTLDKTESYGAVTVHRLPPVGGGQLKKWGLLLSSLPKLVQLQRHYDLIFVSGFRIVGPAAVVISKLFGKCCVLKADSQGEMSGEFFRAGLAKFGMAPSWLPFRLFLALRNTVLKWADSFVAITPEIAAELTASGVSAADIEMIPNSVDTVRFRSPAIEEKLALRRKLNLPQTATIVIYTGRLVSYKGLPLLMRVWQAILQKHPDLYLLLVGTGGLDMDNCEADLRAFVTEHALEPHVRFTGSVQNVPEYLQAADIFAFPTENDAFPSSLIEAMACGLPVVATPVGAIKTIVNHDHNGLLVRPGDFQELLEALDTLIADVARRGRLGHAGRRTVQDRYATDIVTRQYIELFLACTNVRDNSPAPITTQSVESDTTARTPE